jgi:hypothetical protein
MILSLVSRIASQGIIGVSMTVFAASYSPSASVPGSLTAPLTSDVNLTQESLAFRNPGNQQTVINHTLPIVSQIQEPIVVVFTPPQVQEPVMASLTFVNTPVPEPPAYIADLFKLYAGQFNLEVGKLQRIANCESHYHPDSISASGAYVGMFQFSASTWTSTRQAMSLDPNPELRLNAEEAIRTAAWKISHGGLGAWPVCGLR